MKIPYYLVDIVVPTNRSALHQLMSNPPLLIAKKLMGLKLYTKVAKHYLLTHGKPLTRAYHEMALTGGYFVMDGCRRDKLAVCQVLIQQLAEVTTPELFNQAYNNLKTLTLQVEWQLGIQDSLPFPELTTYQFGCWLANPRNWAVIKSTPKYEELISVVDLSAEMLAYQDTRTLSHLAELQRQLANIIHTLSPFSVLRPVFVKMHNKVAKLTLVSVWIMRNRRCSSNPKAKQQELEQLCYQLSREIKSENPAKLLTAICTHWVEHNKARLLSPGYVADLQAFTYSQMPICTPEINLPKLLEIVL